MMAAVSGFFENFSDFVTMPKLLLKANGVWKRVQNYSRVVYEVAEEKIHDAIKKDEVDGSLKGSILGTFIHNLKLKQRSFYCRIRIGGVASSYRTVLGVIFMSNIE